MRALPIWAARQKAKKGNGGGLDHPQRRRTAGPQRQHRRPCCRARSRCEEGRGRAKSRNRAARSEEHTSELQSLMRISYAVFCLKKKKTMQKQKDQMQPRHNTI